MLIAVFLIPAAVSMAQSHDEGHEIAKPEARDAARASMQTFVKDQMSNGTYYFYDAVENRLLALRFKDIHGDVRVQDHFHVSCSDFRDQFGRTVDIDFLAISKSSSFTTVQGVIHSIDGHERSYDLDLKR
jgi:hypothetical protein